MQWAVTVTDNQGADHLYIVAAPTRGAAVLKGKDFFMRGRAKGDLRLPRKIEAAPA